MSTTLDPVVTNSQRMTALVESFPSLRGAPGSAPWDQLAFARWASGPAPSDAMRQAAAFVLSVWNNGNRGNWWNQRPYRAGEFDCVLALLLWDYQHKAAFYSWLNDPFYP